MIFDAQKYSKKLKKKSKSQTSPGTRKRFTTNIKRIKNERKKKLTLKQHLSQQPMLVFGMVNRKFDVLNTCRVDHNFYLL